MTNINPNINKIILDLCGGSGSWSKPYKDAGYRVENITLPDLDVERFCFDKSNLIFYGNNDIQGNLFLPINLIYGILSAPPCTVFSKACWNIKKPERDFVKGMRVVRACLSIIWSVQETGAPLSFWALENPLGYLYNFLGYPAFYFQPWQFGDISFLATKRTALWGYFNRPVKTVKNRPVNIPFINSHSNAKGKLKENKKWYTSSTKDRAITPKCFADAFFKYNN